LKKIIKFQQTSLESHVKTVSCSDAKIFYEQHYSICSSLVKFYIDPFIKYWYRSFVLLCFTYNIFIYIVSNSDYYLF